MATKPPAFQFYASDFLSSVIDMTGAEVGAYIRALAWSWNNGPLPTDAGRLARIMSVTPEEFTVVSAAVLDRFSLANEGYTNDRLESERAKQAEFREAQSTKGKAGAARRWNGTGHLPAIAPAMPVPSLGQWPNDGSSSPSLSSDQDHAPAKNAGGAVPPLAAPPTPALLTFPVIGKGPKEWHLTASYVAELAGDYPGLDVLGECRTARAWCVANFTKRKTAKGLPAFLVNWLNRAVKDGGQRLALVPARQPERPALGAWRDECERVHGGTQGDYCGTQTMHLARMSSAAVTP